MRQDTLDSCYRDGSEDALAAAWPEGLPPEEQAWWEMLGEEQRASASMRIGALLADADAPGAGGARAAAVGMTRGGFAKMRAKWSARRSISVVVPGLLPLGGRGPGERLDPAVRSVVERAVAAHSDWSRDRLVRAIRSELADPPAATTVRPLVDEARRRLERRALGEDAAFGRRIVVGCCRARLPLPHSDAALTAHSAVVIDVPTGRTLGVAASDDPLDAFRRAASDALTAVDGLVDGQPAGRTRWEIQLEADPEALVREIRRIYALPLDVVVTAPATGLREGWRVVELLGDAVGVLQLRPRLEVGHAAIERPHARMTDAEVVEARLRVALASREESFGPRPALAVSRSVLSDELRLLAAR